MRRLTCTSQPIRHPTFGNTLENLRALPGPMQRQFVAYHHMSSRLLKNAAAMAALERVQEAGAGLDRWVEVLSEYYLRIN